MITTTARAEALLAQAAAYQQKADEYAHLALRAGTPSPTYLRMAAFNASQAEKFRAAAREISQEG